MAGTSQLGSKSIGAMCNLKASRTLAWDATFKFEQRQGILNLGPGQPERGFCRDDGLIGFFARSKESEAYLKITRKM